MTDPLSNLIWRGLSRERGRAVLALLAVALGVGLFLAIRLANRAAVASFEGFSRGVASGSEWVVKRDSGGLSERDLEAFLPLLDRLWVMPIVEGSLTLGASNESFQITGIDLLALGEFSPMAPQGSGPSPLSLLGWVGDPQSLLISSTLAREGKLLVGSRLDGFVNDQAASLRVAGVLPDPEGRPPLERGLLVMDLPAAQALLGRLGELDRVELGVREGQKPLELEAEVRRCLPPGWTLEPPNSRASSGQTMTAAFRFNLTVLSLVALVVGAYLLFQGFDAMVMRRQETWATLRALGCSPGLVRRLVLAEAAAIGALGSLLGLGLGWLLAQGAVRAVARTVDVLYGSSHARTASLHLGEALLAFCLGWATCLVAAWLPARQAEQTPPVQLLSRGSQTRPMAWKTFTLLGLGLLLLGMLVAFLPKPPPGRALHAYGGALLVLCGGSLASLGLLPLLGSLGGGAKGWRRRLALRPLQRPTGRHAYATAALAVAVGMTAGMGIMVRSFEATVTTWLESTLRADLYVVPRGAAGAASRHRLSEATLKALSEEPSVAATDIFHLQPLRFRGQDTYLGAGDFATHARYGHMNLLSGESRSVLGQIHEAGLTDPGAVVSETFSRRFGVRVGDHLELPTPAGMKRVVLRGVYSDYGNERGSVIVDRRAFLTWFEQAAPASVALYLHPGVDGDAVAENLRLRFPGLHIRSNQRLRAQVGTIFQQTFAITYALEWVGLTVALAGLAQSLSGLALSRRSELWSLRALGMESSGLATLLLGEGVGVACAGTLGGLGLGYLLAEILVRVLNPQVFGWTLRFVLPWPFLAALMGLTLAAAALVLLPIARWGSRLAVDRAVEEGA